MSMRCHKSVTFNLKVHSLNLLEDNYKMVISATLINDNFAPHQFFFKKNGWLLKLQHVINT